MSRKKRVLKRPTILVDKNFGSLLVSRLINRIMWDGKKTVATNIVNTALSNSAEELQIDPLELLDAVIKNVQPIVEVKSMRIGGASYQVPVEPYPARALRLALTWLVDAARKIDGKPMAVKLQFVLTQAYKGEGPAVAKKKSVEQTAAGNKAFAHFATRGKKKTS